MPPKRLIDECVAAVRATTTPRLHIAPVLAPGVALMT